MSDIDMSLLPDFIVEAEEHLEEMELMLLQLVQDPGNLKLLDDIFRPIHTIKGGAQYIGLEKISKLAHRLEDLLDLLREGNKPSSDEIIEILIVARDRITLLVAELSANSSEESSVDDLVDTLHKMLEADADGEVIESAPPQDDAATPLWGDYQEDDEELFAVFMNHLQVKFAALTLLAQELSQDSDQVMVLHESLELIDALRSSANYMDYVELVQRYQTWKSEVETAIDAVSQGGLPSFEFMERNITELKNSFPQLKTADSATQQVEQPLDQAPPPPDELVDGDVTDAVMQAFSAMENTEMSEPEMPASTSKSPSTAEIDLSLLPDFLVEAEEHLEEMELMLLQLIGEPDNLDLLNDIFRPIHTIKGGAQYIGLERISQLAHRLEDLLDLLREGSKPSSSTMVDTMITARDRIVLLVKELRASSCEESLVDDLVTVLTGMIEGDADSDTMAPADALPQDDDARTEEGYQESDDVELFEIFLDHLRENYIELTLLAKDLPHSNDKITLLDQSLKLIKSLSSSANYMDYVELIQSYRLWSSEVEQAIADLTQGESPEPDVLDGHLYELQQLFPQLADAEITPAALEAGESQIKVVVNEPVAGGLQDTLAKKDSDARSASTESMAPSGELYNNLASALDASLDLGSDVDDYQNLQQIFEELVSKDTEQAASAQKGKNTKKGRPKQTALTRKAKQEHKTPESKIKKSVRVDADKIDALMNQVGELVVDRSYFLQLFNEIHDLQHHFKETLGLEQQEVKRIRTFAYRLGEAIASLGRTSGELQEGIMKMRMLPVSHIFNRYPRLIHDLTRNSGKQVNLVVKGEDTELDRMIVEEVSDPLIHIIRNAVDHGIENTADRAKAGKPEKGTLILEAYQESNHIVIEVTDDGRGIDPEKIRKKALEKGMYSHEELHGFGMDELIPLILTAGFSTADKITGTSGRGVGMDVVKNNIEKLNGTLEIDSKYGVGTQMRLKIPLTLAIIHALMVRVSGEMYTIPLANVDETVRVFDHEITMIEGIEVIHLRGQTLPIFRLATLFDENMTSQVDKSFVVIVNVAGQRTGFVVDELLGQEEVVIKPLDDYVQEKSGFSGATIIGDGRISLILDVYDLVRMTANRQAKKHQQQTQMLKSNICRNGSHSQQVQVV
ncbi:Signal transduction histidine kinase CheA [hydrothermal vent metagenome]|uniref:histidine kinase n=1 Tax=hydrothermal vent metagenome TaxID=652676 RepID=A0A3B1BFX9_9ZZZZ